MAHAAQEAIRIYDRERHRDHAYYFGGHDSRVCVRYFYAFSLWGLGFPRSGPSHGMGSVADARDLGHPFSFAHAFQQRGMTILLLEDVERCARRYGGTLSARRA